MTTRHTPRPAALLVRSDQRLIGVVLSDDEDTIAYFGDEASADAMLSDQAKRRALAAIGAWSHLDPDEVEQALDRIRHDSQPTPPTSSGCLPSAHRIH